MLTLNEVLELIKAEILTLSNCKDVSICTYENLLIRASESKNKYMHVFLVYDLRAVALGEWSQELPLTIVVADKLRANKENELFVHSNTLSLSIEIVKLLRAWAQRNGWDGIDQTLADIWTEDEADALLGGTKFDILLKGNIGGYCDIMIN